jgi:hypothetical protein
MIGMFSCQSVAASSYIGIYEIRCKKSDDTQARIKRTAARIVADLGLKVGDIVDDGFALNLTVKQVYGDASHIRPGLVFSYVGVPGDIWNITITNEGPEEDRSIQSIRAEVEKVLGEEWSSKWSYSVTHHSLAKP